MKIVITYPSGEKMKTNQKFLATLFASGLLANTGLMAGTTPAYNKTYTVGGSGQDMGHAVAYDNSGNVYYGGMIQGASIDVNPTTGTNLVNTNAGSTDALLTKIDGNGNYVWSKVVGANAFDRDSSLVTDAGGNVYLTGNFSGTVNFNPGGTADNHTSANGGAEYDIFVTKINANGTYGWTRVLGGTYYVYGKTIAVDGSGNVYATGYFSIPQNFTQESATATWKTPVGMNDIFLTKLNSNGSYAWTYTLGSTGDDMGHTVTVDASNNVYFSGMFQGTVDLNPTATIGNVASNAGSVDAYIIKLNSTGGYLWTKTWGGSGWDGTYNIDLDAAANIYVSGLFSGTTDLDPSTTAAQNRTAAGIYDLYVTKLNSAGSWLWSRSLGKPGFDFAALGNTGAAMAVDAYGTVFVGRCFTGTMNFNSAATPDNKTSAGGLDAFVTKYNTDGTYGWTRTMGGTGTDCVNALATNPKINVAGSVSRDLLVTGNFTGTANFNPGGTADNKTAVAGDDLFVSIFLDTTKLATASTATAAGYKIQSDALCRDNNVNQRTGTGTATAFWDPAYPGTRPAGQWYAVVRPFVYTLVNGVWTWVQKPDVNSGWTVDPTPAKAVAPAYPLTSWFSASSWGYRYYNGVQTNYASVNSGNCI